MVPSFILLGMGLWTSLFAINALRPIYRPPFLAVVSFFSFWLTVEVAVQHIVYQLPIAGLLIALDGLEHWGGQIGLALLVANWLTLGFCAWRGFRTRTLCERALQEGLGADYQEHIEPELRERLPARLPIRSWWLAWPVRPHRVEKIADIDFTNEDEPTLHLDLYRHRDRPTGCPILLEVHGGGWVIGDKREQGLPLMHHLAGQGWLCASANYRLSPGGSSVDHVIDLKRAIRWLRAHAAEYGGDPSFIAVTGESAGGHLSALVALTPNEPTYQPGFEDVDTTLQACISFYGIYDLADREGDWPHDGFLKLVEEKVLKVRLADAPETYDEFSPLCRLGPAAPPTFVLHGDQDTLAPVNQARRFVRAFREKCAAPLAYAELTGAQHAFDIFPSPRAMYSVYAVERFLSYACSRRG